MTMMIKEPPLKSRCRIKWWNQAMGKGAKTVHQQKITVIIEQLQKTDPTITVYQFYTTDKNTSDQPYPPLQGKMKLPQDPVGLQQYCPGQAPPEQPDCKGCFLDSGKNKIAKTSEYATAEIVAFSALVGDDTTDQVQMNDDNEECHFGGDEGAQDNDYNDEEMMNEEEEAILPQVANKYDMFGIDDEDASIKDWMEDVVEDIVDSETENVQNITDVTEGMETWTTIFH